ncbi:flagellar protein FliT [Paenibacillus sp. LjRoot153]|uniref:flagellar protein FliT n=1 Tax=Paenibacillus sp. LjRoot153 TaxID=3342270 RepID=UPI003ED068D3
MDKLLQSLKRITQGIIVELDQKDYEQLGSFVEERQIIIDQLQSMNQSFNDQQKLVIKDILQHDDVIVRRMQQLKDEAKSGIDKIERARVHNNAYEQPYAQESYFFDKKK